MMYYWKNYYLVTQSFMMQCMIDFIYIEEPPSEWCRSKMFSYLKLHFFNSLEVVLLIPENNHNRVFYRTWLKKNKENIENHI